MPKCKEKRRDEPDDVGDRERVVYVGSIRQGTTRADLRKRFEVFGPIDEVTLRYRARDHGG